MGIFLIILLKFFGSRGQLQSREGARMWLCLWLCCLALFGAAASWPPRDDPSVIRTLNPGNMTRLSKAVSKQVVKPSITRIQWAEHLEVQVMKASNHCQLELSLGFQYGFVIVYRSADEKMDGDKCRHSSIVD